MSKLETKMHGFDIVSTVTQTTINKHFAALKRIKQIPDTLDFKLPRGLGTLTTKLLAPTVTLGLEGDRRKVLFSLNFAEGTFRALDDHDVLVEIPFGAARIGLLVDVDLAHLDVAGVPPAVRDAVKNLGDGMFSIRQLLLDFQNATVASYDPKHTTLPKELLDDPLFIAGLTMLFRTFHEKGTNILGYAVTVKNPNDVAPDAPTFPPTNLDFATRIYDAGGCNADLDSLDYLMMTEHRPLPGNVLPVGAFVDGESDGTMAIARSVFVEGYLLPTLAKLTNRTSKFPYISWYDSSISTETGGAFIPNDGSFDIDDLVEPLRGLIASGNSFTPPPIPAPTTNARCWSFLSHEETTKTEGNEPIWGSNTVVRGLVSHACELRITPGENTLELRGACILSTSWTVWAGLVNFAMCEFHWLTSTLDWTASIRLIADGSGHATARITYEAKPVATEQGGNWVAKIGNAMYTDQAHAQIKNIETALKDGFGAEKLKADLEAAFSKQNAFIFPGGQQYFFKDLVFNNDLDLLASLTIKFY